MVKSKQAWRQGKAKRRVLIWEALSKLTGCTNFIHVYEGERENINFLIGEFKWLRKQVLMWETWKSGEESAGAILGVLSFEENRSYQ